MAEEEEEGGVGKAGRERGGGVGKSQEEEGGDGANGGQERGEVGRFEQPGFIEEAEAEDGRREEDAKNIKGDVISGVGGSVGGGVGGDAGVGSVRVVTGVSVGGGGGVNGGAGAGEPASGVWKINSEVNGTGAHLEANISFNIVK